MKFTSTLTAATILFATLASAAPAPLRRSPAPEAPVVVAPVAIALSKRDFGAKNVIARGAKRSVQIAPSVHRRSKKRAVDAGLIPQFGHPQGLNPTGTGDCDGINGIKIPCACPPDRQFFIDSLNRNVEAGRAVNNPGVAVSFPTDSSKASQLARMQTALVTLQNLNGPGQGCPAASTTFLAQQKAIQDFNAAAPAAPAPPPPAAPAPAPAPAPAAGGSVASLAPALGLASGINPTGTGDCDGINGIKIPCSCPPAQDVYIRALEANVAAGRAVNNPGVSIQFPTDNSAASQRTRITAALITLQNLNGPGVGCPAASTTLLAQQAALN